MALQLAQAQETSLSITNNGGPMSVRLSGEASQFYQLQAAPALTGTNGWVPLLSLTLTNGAHAWFDADSTWMGRRFYRVVKIGPPPAPPRARNFSLIDQTGKVHELHYPTNKKAIVLIFSATGSTNIQQRLASIKALRDQFSGQGVEFWMVDESGSVDRSPLVSEAIAQGNDLPVLHDRARMVAKDFGVTTATETVVVDPRTMTVIYRGEIDDRRGPDGVATTQSFLSAALTEHLAGRAVTIRDTRAHGDSLSLPASSTVSYSARIAPLLQNKCVRCHAPGNIAYWAMTNHSVVQLFAPLIRDQVLARQMPPWHADPQFGVFTNNAALTPSEVTDLLQWISDGAVKGAELDPLTNSPSAGGFPFAWPAALGTPDVVLSIPTQSLPASGVIAYRYLDVPSSLGSNVWLRAAVVKPGNAAVVHHCLVYTGTSSSLMGLDGYFAGYVPGAEPVTFPSGTGKLLPHGTSLRFQMHYTSTGQPETDTTQIGLYFATTTPASELQTRSAYDPLSFLSSFFYSIPAGAANYPATTAQYNFPAAVWLYELSPHMHYRGSSFKYEAVYPGGAREVLLSVPKYDFHWQTLYRLAQPKLLPAGTAIVCTGTFDNSVLNRDNPNPAQTVIFGEQTTDEMFIGYFNFSVAP